MKPHVPETQPLTGWERIKQEAKEAIAKAGLAYHRAEDIRRELNPLDIQTIRYRLGDVEDQIVAAIGGKTGQGPEPEADAKIDALMDDWRTIQGIIKARTS